MILDGGSVVHHRVDDAVGWAGHGHLSPRRFFLLVDYLIDGVIFEGNWRVLRRLPIIPLLAVFSSWLLLLVCRGTDRSCRVLAHHCSGISTILTHHEILQ